jgi:cytochrome c biogenesis protein CcmG/thiol:disulfide interchange protein DsbE
MSRDREPTEQQDQVTGYGDPPASTSHADPRKALWRWFRLVGVPVIAVTVIAAAILLLRAPSDGGGSVRLDAGGADSEETGSARPEEGKLAPDFVLQSTDGTTYRLSELRGHPVMINFWATWCGPCKDEMPAIEEAYRAHAGDGLIVLAINVRESARLVEPYVAKLRLTFPVLLDPSGSVSDRYRVRSLPTTWLVRADGTIDGWREGAYTKRILSGRLDQLIDRD